MMNHTLNDARPSFRTFLAIVALACLGGVEAGAHELKDIAYQVGAAEASLKLSFSKTDAADGEYPLYFQKVDGAKGTLTLSFLETGCPFPLGRHAVSVPNSAVQEILLKRMTSPSGKSFLGVELKLKEPAVSEAPMQPLPQGALRITLGGGSKSKVNWSLAKTTRAAKPAEQALAEPAEPQGQFVPPPDGLAPGEVADAGSPAIRLKEIKLVVARSQEDVVLVFDPPSSSPVHSAGSDPRDSSVLEIQLDDVASGLKAKEYSLPQSAHFRKVGVSGKDGRLVLRFQLASRSPVHVLPADGTITLTGAGSENAQPFKWSTNKPGALPPLADADGKPGLRTAHEDGAAVDASKAGKGLSSSRTFTVGDAGKTMVVLLDSVALNSVAGSKSKVLRRIPLGEKVEILERRGGWIRAVFGPDTGYIRQDAVAYEDELTLAQEKGLQSALEAKASQAAKQAEAEVSGLERNAGGNGEGAAAKSPDAKPGKAGRGANLSVPTGNAAPGPGGPRLSMTENSELAEKAAMEKRAADAAKARAEATEPKVAYNSYGRRDPFIPVDQSQMDQGIDIDQMKVVGIIWQSHEPMAVLEHNREAGVSYTVKQGDPVHNGRVARITRDAVTFDISEYGISRSYSLKLVSSKEGTKK